MKDRPNWRDEGEDAGQAMEEFQDRHRSFSDRVERFIMQLVILGLVALVLMQTLQVIPFVRRYVSYAEALEGVSASEVTAWRTGSDPAEAAIPAGGSQAGKYSVTVVLMTDRAAPTARLLVDGRVAGTFIGSTVTAQVRPGQTLTVDGSRIEKALTFRVVAAPGLASPALGAEVRTNGDRQNLGTVQVAD